MSKNRQGIIFNTIMKKNVHINIYDPLFNLISQLNLQFFYKFGFIVKNGLKGARKLLPMLCF